MPEVHKVTVQVRAPSDRDPGQVSFGYYVVEDGLLTMTDADGAPVRRRLGELMQKKLQPSEDPATIARSLTRELRRHFHGDGAGFNRPIEYARTGWR